MTSVIERIVAIIAPFSCIACSNNNNIMCDACLQDVKCEASFCAFCGQNTADWRICQTCARKTVLNHVWVGAEYEESAQKLMQRFKFDRARAAYIPLAKLLELALPYLPSDWLIVPVPTASVRIRQRGYDQAHLVARQLARQQNLPLVKALGRYVDTRQMGANREQRQIQAEKAFYVSKKDQVKNRKILLVDDVCTTGATLSATAKLLKKAGAAEVNAVVCAWQPPKNSRHI